MGNSYSLPLPSRKRTSDASSDRPHSQLIETPFKRPRTHKFTQTENPESSKAAAQMWFTDDCRYSEKSKEYLSQQVFLSHSGKQKNFVEQLYTDLDRENISCFFDKDPQSLPKGVDFPSRIFEAAAKCKVAVVVLTDDFISSKWPMQELCAFVNAKRISNPGLKILPLFFGISSETFSQMIRSNNFPTPWNNLQKSDKRIDLVEWIDALKALRPINGVNYIEGEGEVAYRRQIIGHIRRLLPPSSKYEESHVQGKERLCEEVAKLFNMTPCSKNGVKIAGLYGVGGTGKTTMCRIICNFYCGDFEGRVLHIELQRKSTVKTLKHALRIFTDASETLLDSVTSKDHVQIRQVAWFARKRKKLHDSLPDERKESVGEMLAFYLAFSRICTSDLLLFYFDELLREILIKIKKSMGGLYLTHNSLAILKTTLQPLPAAQSHGSGCTLIF